MRSFTAQDASAQPCNEGVRGLCRLWRHMPRTGRRLARPRGRTRM